MDLSLCPEGGKYLIVILTFITKLHQVAITFTENFLSGCSTVYAIYPAGDESSYSSLIYCGCFHSCRVCFQLMGCAC